MSARASATVAAVGACAIVLAQIVVPGEALYHTWQYALALAVLGYLVISYAAPALRGADGTIGKWLGVAMLGVVIVIADGMASGLLGPDTERIVRAPGTVAPLPDIGAAAFFSGASPRTIEEGTATIALRRRNAPDIAIAPGSRKFLGASVVQLESRPAAFVDATDDRGNHLTITQQTGAFLSPVLLFRQAQSIAGRMHPVDGFQLPGANRSVKAVYFSAGDVGALHVPSDALGRPALLYDVFDSASNRSLGIAIAPSGSAITIGGIVLHTAVGSYPRLIVASAPEPDALGFGLLLFVLGLASAGYVMVKRMFVPPTEGTRSGGDTFTWLHLRSRLSHTRPKSGTSQD